MPTTLYKSPEFSIVHDSMQWILRISKEQNHYHSTITYLLNDLSETMFRRFTQSAKNINDLKKSVDKVYKLIDKIALNIYEPR